MLKKYGYEQYPINNKLKMYKSNYKIRLTITFKANYLPSTLERGPDNLAVWNKYSSTYPR